MRSPYGNALPIKALSLLAAKPGVCLGRRRRPQRICKERFETVPYTPPPSRRVIIFDLKVVLHDMSSTIAVMRQAGN